MKMIILIYMILKITRKHPDIMKFESVQRSRAEQNLSWFDKCLLQDVAFSANVKLLEANSSVYFEEPFQYRIHSAMVRYYY